MPLHVEQAHAQRLQRTGTPVVGGTAADGQDDAPGTGIQRGTHQLPGAEGAADARITLLQRHQLQTAGFCHLNDRGVAFGQPTPMGLDRLAQWSLHPSAAQLASAGGENRLDRAFTAVGHRAFDQLRIRPDIG
ncbi:hypothetical protein D3C72_1873750 [compost metagenome]